MSLMYSIKTCEKGEIISWQPSKLLARCVFQYLVSYEIVVSMAQAKPQNFAR